MRRLTRRWALLLLVLLPAGSALAAPESQQTGALSLDVQAGYDGFYQEGRWIPLRIQVSNDGSDIDAVLRAVDDSSYVGEVVFTHPVELPSGSRKEIHLYFSSQGYLSTLDVELVAGNRRLAAKSVTLRQVGAGDILYGVLSDNPSAFGELGLVAPVGGDAQVALLEASDLPPVAEAWRALDVLVFSDVDTGQFNSGQRAALEAWLASGGRVIVTGGAGWQRTAAGLDPLLPVDVSGSTRVDDLSSLSALMDLSPQQFQAETLVSVAEPRPGAQVGISQDGLPVWVWWDVGQGRVDYLAADPALEPLRSAPQMEVLWHAILSDGRSAPGWSWGFNSEWYYAREAVASIPGVSLPSALQLCGFLSLYALIVGPLNYIILKRMKRTELAWLTIPAVVLLFSGCAYVTGYQVRGSRAILHRLAMVQSWPDSEVARVDGVVGLWSPRRSAYDVQVGDAFLAQPLPGDYGSGLGVSSRRVIEQGEGSLLRNVRVDVGAVQSFLVEGYAPAVHVQSDLKMTLDSAGGLSVKGEVLNTSGIDLQDAVVLAAGAAQQVGDLPDGQQAQVDVSMLSGYASAVSSGGFQLAAGIVPGNTAYGSTYDSTVDDIMGTAYCYGNSETERRCNLLRAVISQYSGSGRGAGVYLVGWADETPLDVQLPDANTTSVDTAVYFFALPVTVERVGQQVTVPPSLMTWSALSSEQDRYNYNTYSPYDVYLSPTMEGPYAFSFEPLPIVPLERVTDLTVHVEGYQSTSNVSPPEVELWDWQQDAWQPVAVGWGDTDIPQPERFVSDGGAVHLRVWVDSTSPGLSLDRVDVTLEGTASS